MTAMQSPAARWFALATLVGPVLLLSIDMSVISIAVPAISAGLGPTSAQMLWIIDIYSFLLAGLLILAGSLGDRFGRKRMLMIGAPAFGLASLATAFAPNPELLILARAALGASAATLMPSTLGLIRTIFDNAHERRLAIAVWAAAFGGGGALGPVLGGLLLEHFWWGSVFLINAPVMALFLPAAWYLLPESRDPNPQKFDYPSAALSIAGLLPVVYALKTLIKQPSVASVVALVAGITFIALFLRRQRRIANPMIDLELFARPGFAAAITVNMLATLALLGLTFFYPQYLMLVKGHSSMSAGLWMLPLALATMAGTFVSPSVAKRVSIRKVITIGSVITAFGFGLASFLDTGSAMLLVVVAAAAVGFGIGFSETLTNEVVLSTAPPARASAASAISETGYEFGGAMGTALLGTLGLGVYARNLHADEHGLEGAQAVSARDTLGGAHEIAASLPADQARQLIDAANDAYLTGMNVATGAGALIALGAAAAGWWGIREYSRRIEESVHHPQEISPR
ncbi:MFS transporter [Corynebacterium sp. MNWGS58]|uniref:MFS transporter n=1 Tax=Corynebacterium sp. 102791.4 TaxID=3104612 RepID=UPI003514DD51